MENGDQIRIQLEATPRQYQAGNRHFQSWKILALPLILFIAIPLVALFTHTSLSDLVRNLNQRQVIEAIRLSLVTSLSAMLITLVFGTPVAYLLAQQNGWSHRLVDTLIDLPLVIPPSVAGVALLMTFGRQGWIGDRLSGMGINVPFTTLAVIMAQVFIASPFYVKAASIGFAAIDPELKQAAALDGASIWRTFSAIDVPLSRMALLSGSVMTWARALGEFGATIIFAGNFPGRTQTMPMAIYMGFEIDLDVALTLSIILISLSFITLIIVKGISHQQVDA
jgi:molybdate transport system permease protein